MVYIFALLDASAHFGAADVVERRVQQVSVVGQTLFVDWSVAARIDDNLVVSQNIFIVYPLIEYQPVVGSDDERE